MAAVPDGGRGVGAFFRRTFRSLGNRNYRLFFIGQFISSAGHWMQGIAEIWLVLELTDDSGLAVGIVSALRSLPLLFGGAYAGLIADRVDKHRLLVVTQVLNGLLALALWGLVASTSIALWTVYLLTFLAGTVRAVDNPTRRAFVYEMVGRSELSNAASLTSFLQSSARAVGPMIAGVVIGTAGVEVCFLVNALSFIPVIIALLLMDRAALHRTPPVTRAKGQLREGLRYAWATPDVRLPLLMMAVIGTLAFNYQVVMALLSRVVFEGGASTFGLMMSSVAVGSLLGALNTASRDVVSRGFLVGSAMAFGVVILGASAAPGLALVLPMLVLVGLFGTSFNAAANARLQMSSAAHMQGRMVALLTVLFLGSTPIGGPLVGALAGAFGPRVAFAMGGVAALATGLVTWWWLRRRQTDPASPSTEAPVEVPLDSGLAPEVPVVGGSRRA